MLLSTSRRKWVWAYAPVLLWLAVIFFLSSPQGSFEETSRIIGPLLHFFFPSITPQTEAIVHFYVRKTAHFTEYAVLAFLLVRAFTLSSVGWLKNWRYMLPIVFVAIVASI